MITLHNCDKIVLATLIAIGLFGAAVPAEAKPNVGKAISVKTPLPSSKSYDFGKNVTPRYARETNRPDGKSSVVYGNTPSPATAGKIGKPHGHTVRARDGTIDYARTPSGQVRIDKKRTN